MNVSGELQTLGQRKDWLYVISFSRNGLSGPIVRPMTVPVARVISVYQAQETKCSLEGAMTVPLQDVSSGPLLTSQITGLPPPVSPASVVSSPPLGRAGGRRRLWVYDRSVGTHHSFISQMTGRSYNRLLWPTHPSSI